MHVCWMLNYESCRVVDSTGLIMEIWVMEIRKCWGAFSGWHGISHPMHWLLVSHIHPLMTISSCIRSAACPLAIKCTSVVRATQQVSITSIAVAIISDAESLAEWSMLDSQYICWGYSFSLPNHRLCIYVPSLLLVSSKGLLELEVCVKAPFNNSNV